MSDRYYDTEGKTVAVRLNDHQFDVEKLHHYFTIYLGTLSSVGFLDEYDGQLSLTHRSGCPLKYQHLDGVKPIPGRDIGEGEGRGDERDINQINELLPDEFKQVLAEFSEAGIDLFRARFMSLACRSCYTVHSDATPRLHLPLFTYEHSWFVMKDVVPFNLPADGYAWLVDTRRWHTVVNGVGAGDSTFPRTHLVAIVDNEMSRMFEE